MLTKIDFEKAVEACGLGGSSVLVHSSLRSFGEKVEEGPQTILEAFLSKGCTVMVPSFSYGFQCAPEGLSLPACNGISDYAAFIAGEKKNIAVYTPECGVISAKEMGAFPDYLIRRAGYVRGDHPINSFAAVGPVAKRLILGQTAKDVYAPLRTLCEDDGYVLLMGENLDHATIIHYAEQLSGRKLFIRWALDKTSTVMPCAVGSCSDGFGRLDDAVAGIEKRFTVGQSVWRIFRARELVNECVKAIRENPSVTHCSNPSCERCNDAQKNGPVFVFPN